MGKPKKVKYYHKIIMKIPAIFLFLVLIAAGAVPSHGAFNSLLRDIPKLSGVSEVILLESLDDGSVIFNRNDTLRTAPASLTKIVTAILAMEHCENLYEVITVKPECITMFYGINSANAGIKIGEELTVEQLLYCLMVPSGNEAAAILADYTAGSQEAFVAQMNEFTQRMGLEDTQFMNAHGLDEEGHYTTARDVAAIVRYALGAEFKGNALFEKIIGALTYEIPETNKNNKRTLLNTNRMLNRGYRDYYCADVSGVKTGSTRGAGECVVAKASRGGFNYLCIVMRGDKVRLPPKTYDVNTAFVDAKAILEWSFTHIKLRQVADREKAVGEVPVELARNADHVQLRPKEDLVAFVPEGIDSKSVLVEIIPELTPEKVMAPVYKDQPMGAARILFAGEEFARVELVAADNVSRSAVLFLVSLARQFVQTSLAKALLFAVLFAAGIYLIVLLLQQRGKRRERQLRILPTSVAEKRKRK